MPNPKPTILEYLVELKKARITQDKVKTTILKLLLEKEITREEILKTLGYTTTRNASEGMKIQMKLFSNRIQSYLRKLWLEDYIDRKGRKYYLKPTLKNQYKALLQLLKKNESNLFLETLKEYVPEGGKMPRIRREARKGKMITSASWDSKEIKLLLEATEDMEKVIPDIEEEYKDPKDFKKALKRFLELSDDMKYDDVSLTIVPKNPNEYPRFRISFSDTGEIRIYFVHTEDKSEYQNITKAIDLLEEAKKTLLNVRGSEHAPLEGN